jgi:hypothetical protein
MQIFIKTEVGNTLMFEVEQSDSVFSLLSKIQYGKRGLSLFMTPASARLTIRSESHPGHVFGLSLMALNFGTIGCSYPITIYTGNVPYKFFPVSVDETIWTRCPTTAN